MASQAIARDGSEFTSAPICTARLENCGSRSSRSRAAVAVSGDQALRGM